MDKRTGRHAIIEQFIADGMTYMFGNPGTVEQGFLDVLRDNSKMKYILGLQETIPLGIADGYARATKRPTLVQLHTGVGLGNGIGMMYQAKRGHAPLVVIAGDAGVCYDSMDAQMACDLVEMAKPVTKFATRVTDPASLLRVLRKAIKIAATPPMGPVFIDLPMDVLDAANDEEVIPTLIPDTKVKPDDNAVNNVAQMLSGAERPMIIMGDGVSVSGAQAELAKVAEMLGAEVWGADNSEINIDSTHPLYKGNLGHMFGSHSTPIVSQMDAVLIVGTYVLPEVFPSLSNIFRTGAKVAHIDLNAYEIGKNHPVDIGLVADPQLTLAALAKSLEQNMTSAQKESAAKRFKTLGDQKENAIKSALESHKKIRDAVPMKPGRFMEELAKRVDDDVVIFDEALTSSPELNLYMPSKKPGHFFQTRGGSLGVGIPGAIGLKLAMPDKTVLGFTGDGGSMYTIQSLWTAAKYNIGAKFVICNNRSYKLLKLNIHQYWRERDIAEREFPDPFDLSRPAMNFAKIAESLNVPAVRVERPEEIAPALDKAFETDGPFLIEVVLSNEVEGHKIGVKCGQ